jgi:hypothetical protein
MWAEAQCALDHALAGEDFASWSDLFGPQDYLPALPICPNMGTYTVNVTRVFPGCTVPWHVAP